MTELTVLQECMEVKHFVNILLSLAQEPKRESDNMTMDTVDKQCHFRKLQFLSIWVYTSLKAYKLLMIWYSKYDIEKNIDSDSLGFGFM